MGQEILFFLTNLELSSQDILLFYDHNYSQRIKYINSLENLDLEDSCFSYTRTEINKTSTRGKKTEAKKTLVH